MAEGAERFRGLWEDEMFARQEELAVIKGSPHALKRGILEISPT